MSKRKFEFGATVLATAFALMVMAVAIFGLATPSHAQVVSTYTNGSTNTTNQLQGVAIVATGQVIGSQNVGDAATNTVGMLVVPENKVYNGTTWDRQRGDTNGISVQQGLSANLWNSPAPAGGIASATTVQVMPAQGAGVRLYVTGGDCAGAAVATATEIALLDGATVVWRSLVNTNANGNPGYSFTFSSPIRGTAATALSFQMFTSPGGAGALYCNFRGFTGP